LIIRAKAVIQNWKQVKGGKPEVILVPRPLALGFQFGSSQVWISRRPKVALKSNFIKLGSARERSCVWIGPQFIRQKVTEVASLSCFGACSFEYKKKITTERNNNNNTKTNKTNEKQQQQKTKKWVIFLISI